MKREGSEKRKKERKKREKKVREKLVCGRKNAEYKKNTNRELGKSSKRKKKPKWSRG